MNLPSFTIPSSLRLLGVASLVATLLWGCGGSAPPPEREHPRSGVESEPKHETGEKGSGAINFVYSNKSTDARMEIDLGSTDVYLEMSGRPAKSVDELGHDRQPGEKSATQSNRTKPTETPQSPEDESESARPKKESESQRLVKKSEVADAKALEENVNNEDVTAKVLVGIRRAQELFYQKRYPEALQMVRQSLDASPTAEGHALAGSICYMMSKNGLARRHWEEALRLNPDMPAVVNMLERTRTPGGRGSPSPRPLVNRAPIRPPVSVMEAAIPESEQPPYPEVFRNDPSRLPPVTPVAVPVKSKTPEPVPAEETEPIETEEAEATEGAAAVQTPVVPEPAVKEAPPPKPVFPTKTTGVAKPDSSAKKPKRK